MERASAKTWYLVARQLALGEPSCLCYAIKLARIPASEKRLALEAVQREILRKHPYARLRKDGIMVTTGGSGIYLWPYWYRVPRIQFCTKQIRKATR